MCGSERQIENNYKRDTRRGCTNIFVPVQDEVVYGQPSGDFRYTTRRTEKHRMPSVTHEAVERIPIHAGGRHLRQELVKKKGGGLDLIRRLLSFGPIYHIIGHS